MSGLPPFRPSQLLKTLTQRGVDFVVIGGIAAVAHGAARVTRDLDICFASDQANLDTLGDVLVQLQATLREVSEPVPFVPDAETLRRVELLTLDTRFGPLDVHVRPSGSPPYSQLRHRADRIDVDGVSVLVASLEDLLAMKRSAGRPQDLADVEELEAIRRVRRRLARRRSEA